MSIDNKPVFVKVGKIVIRRDTIVAISKHTDGTRVWTGNGDQNSEGYMVSGYDCMELFSRIFPEGQIIDTKKSEVAE